MVSTHLKNIGQIGSISQVGVKIKNIWNHHLVWVLLSAGSGADFGIQSTHIPRSNRLEPNPTPGTRNLKGSGVVITKDTKQGFLFQPKNCTKNQISVKIWKFSLEWFPSTPWVSRFSQAELLFRCPHFQLKFSCNFPVAWGAKPKQVVVTVLINVLDSMISCTWMCLQKQTVWKKIYPKSSLKRTQFVRKTIYITKICWGGFFV